MAHILPGIPAATQGFTFAGRVNIGYTTPGAPIWWRDVYSCTICSALVLANEKHDETDAASNLVRHARWHKQTGTYKRDDQDRPDAR